MDQSALYTYIGSLVNDPSHDRYSTSIIDAEMEAVQARWNIAANVLKQTSTITVVDGTTTYTFGTAAQYPIKILRVTHKGVDIKKRDKAWFDLYTSRDWTADTGTPTQFYFDDTQTLGEIVVYPIPQSGDAGANLVVEYVYPQTAMAATTDLPWNSSNGMIPYHYGFAKEVAGNLLARDPSTDNVNRAKKLLKDADRVLEDVVNYFAALVEEEPPRLKGGRNWNY